MFQFVYATGPDEQLDTQWFASQFVGIEAETNRDGFTRVGINGLLPEEGLKYVVHPPVNADWTSKQCGDMLRQTAGQFSGPNLLFPPSGPFISPRLLWQLLEDARHERVKIALDIDSVIAAGVRPSVIVPTLNLRIGLVRARTPGEPVVKFARRLAGIGFGGYVVIDPLAGPDRAKVADELIAQFRSIFPVKPAKKVPAKAG